MQLLEKSKLLHDICARIAKLRAIKFDHKVSINHIHEVATIIQKIIIVRQLLDKVNIKNNQNVIMLTTVFYTC